MSVYGAYTAARIKKQTPQILLRLFGHFGYKNQFYFVSLKMARLVFCGVL